MVVMADVVIVVVHVAMLRFAVVAAAVAVAYVTGLFWVQEVRFRFGRLSTRGGGGCGVATEACFLRNVANRTNKSNRNNNRSNNNNSHG